MTGGNGGAGGIGGVSYSEGGGGGGGGGGAGGYGAILTGATANTNTSTIAGGDGAAGGNGGNGSGADLGGGNGGNGGDGGIGVYVATTGASLTNSGTIQGGNGGAAGIAGAGGGGGSPPGSPGIAGLGGAGIVGGGLTIINSGSIIGGLAGDGVTRANAIAFTGGTNLLELQAGSIITGNVVAFSTADTLQLGGTTSASFDVSQIGAQYQGFGIFQKTGSGAWTLTGTNAAVLPWTINTGTLAVNGTMSNATMTVNSGGTLAGTGTVNLVQVNSGGTLAPAFGTPGSTLTVTGNLAFQSGAHYLVHLSPSSASRAVVSGSATLAGNMRGALGPGNYTFGTSYSILHADGGFGSTTFANASVPNFNASLDYTATDVILTLNAATLGAGATHSQNQRNVAEAINNVVNLGGLVPARFAGVFGASGGNLSNALTLLSGEAATGAQRGAFQLTSQFLGIMLDPFLDSRGRNGGSPAIGFAPERETLPDDIALAYAKAMNAPVNKAPPMSFEQRWTTWAGAYGGYNRTDGDPTVIGSHDVTARTAGFAAGADYRVSRDAVFGFALAGGGTNWDLAQGLGGGKSDAFQAGIYAAARFGASYVAASLAFANHWMSTDRLAAFGEHLQASFNAQSFGGRVEAGTRVATGIGSITPYAAVQAQTFRTPFYGETDLTGGGFALSYNARTASNTRSEVGARFDHVALVDRATVLTLRGRLAWAHDWVSDPSLTAVFQALPGASFIVNGAAPTRDAALASAGAELRLASGVTLLGKFDGEFAGRSNTYASTGTVRMAW